MWPIDRRGGSSEIEDDPGGLRRLLPATGSSAVLATAAASVSLIIVGLTFIFLIKESRPGARVDRRW